MICIMLTALCYCLDTVKSKREILLAAPKRWRETSMSAEPPTVHVFCHDTAENKSTLKLK